MKIFKKRKLSEEIEKYDNYRLAEVLELKDDIQPVADVAQADAFKSIKKLDKRAKEAFKEVEKNVEPVVKSTHNRTLGIVDKTDAMKKMGLVESFNKKFPSVDYSISHKNKDRFLKVYTESLNQAKSISTWASGNKIPCYIKKSKGVYSCVLKEEWVDEDACHAGIAQDLNYLIKDELEAVDGYNSVLATWRDADKFPEVIAVLKDIVDEEMLHIGQLQRALELVSPNAKNIQAGVKEAEEQIVDEAEKQKEKEIEKAEEKFRDKIDVEVEDSVEDIEDGEKEVVDIDVVEESLNESPDVLLDDILSWFEDHEQAKEDLIIYLKNNKYTDEDIKDLFGIVEESKKCKTKKLSEDYVNINKTELADFIKEAVQNLKEDVSSTYHYPLINNLYFVMGVVSADGYDKEDLKSMELTEEGHVICGKIAVNSDDLQMDYDYDWTIPYYKDGEIVEDEITILKGTNYNDLASYIIRRVKELSKFDISKEGLITESMKSSKLEKEGIQYFGTKNQYNYDKMQLRIDHDNKTYQLGAFTHISKRETVSTPELKRIIERLKELGYKEIKKDNLKEEKTDESAKKYFTEIGDRVPSKVKQELKQKGIYVYEIRDNDTVQKYVFINNIGSLLTNFELLTEDNPIEDLYGDWRKSAEDNYEYFEKYIKYINKVLDEDVKKLPNGKWANVGKDGKANSGTFKTKKEAEAQMRAMYANGYKESIKKEGMKDTLDAYVKGETLEERYEPYSSFKTFEYKDKTEQGYDVVKIFRDLDDDRVHIIFHRTKPEDYNIGLGYSLDDGVWNQGRYNFNRVEDAEEILKRKYNVEDITDTFKEKKIEVKEDLEEEQETDKSTISIEEKFKMLKEYPTYKTFNSKRYYTRPVKIYDLGLTPEQKEKFEYFLQDGLDYFWRNNEELAKDIYQEGRMGGHLVLDIKVLDPEDYINFDNYQKYVKNYLENNYYPDGDDGEYLQYQIDDAKKEVDSEISLAYDKLMDFDDRVNKLIEKLKETLDNFDIDSDNMDESLKKDLKEEKIEKGPFQVIWYVMEDDHPRCECFKEKEKAIEYCNKHKEDKDKLEMQAVEVNDKDEIVDYLVL